MKCQGRDSRRTSMWRAQAHIGATGWRTGDHYVFKVGWFVENTPCVPCVVTLRTQKVKSRVKFNYIINRSSRIDSTWW